MAATKTASLCWMPRPVVELLRLPTPSVVSTLAYSPDGRRLIAGCQDGTIHIFDSVSGAEGWSAPVGADPGASVASLTVSDDARWVAAISTAVLPESGVRVGALGVYDLASGTPRYPPVELGGAGLVVCSPTLRHVVASAPFGRPVPPGPGGGLTVIDFRTGSEVSNSNSAVTTYAVAADGGSLATGAGGVVEVYDLGVEVSRYSVGASLTGIEMSPTGTSLVAVTDTSPAVTVVVADSGARLARKPIPGTIAATAFADQGQVLAVGGSDGIRVFSIAGAQVWKVDTVGPVNALAAVGPTGEWLGAAAGKTVRLLDSGDGHSRWAGPAIHPQTVTRIAASSDGKWVATGCADRKARIIDTLTGAETFAFEGDGKVQAVVFQPGRSLLAAGNEDGTVIFVDAETVSEQGRLTRGIGCSRIAFSFDATMVAVGWDDNTVCFYEMTAMGSPQLLQELTCAAPISALAFNPTDNSVAVAAATTSVSVHDPRSGIELARFRHPQPVRHLAFSADGALIATTSDDAMMRVWTSGSATNGIQDEEAEHG